MVCCQLLAFSRSEFLGCVILPVECWSEKVRAVGPAASDLTLEMLHGMDAWSLGVPMALDFLELYFSWVF